MGHDTGTTGRRAKTGRVESPAPAGMVHWRLYDSRRGSLRIQQPRRCTYRRPFPTPFFGTEHIDDSNVPDQPTRGLLEYAIEQQTFQIGNVRIGGRPGAQPTVLIGTIFYHKHDVVINADRGEINTAEAEKRIRLQEDYSARTGNPCMFDVVGATPEAIVRNLEFAARTTTRPLLIDGTTAEVRIAGLKYVAQAGLADRIVYNSIQPEITENEFTAIQEAGVQQRHPADLLLDGLHRQGTGPGRA